MRRSIATVCLSGLLEDKLAAIAAAGFDGVEIFENDLIAFDGAPGDIRALAQELGLHIDAYQPLRDFEGVDEKTFRLNIARAEHKLDIAKALGAPLLLVVSNVSPGAGADEDRAAAQLRALAERAAERGIKIGYKALSWGAHVSHAQQAYKLIERVDHPHLGLVLDSFHSLALGDDPKVLSKIPGDRIFWVQIADAPKMTLDPLTWSRHYRCFPGQGDLDVAGFLSAVLASGYTGPVSLEIWNDELRAASPRLSASDGYRSLLWLEETLAAAKPKISKVELFDPAPASALTGVSFIEFAADGIPATELDTFFSGFGFTKAGMHRSKNVVLYRSGAVNLVLNAEPNSFAQSYFLLHGPSICAIGLRADDEQQALSRALDYHCAQFSGRVGPNELSIPAVRAPDGSLIYFVGAAVESGGLYEIEFHIDAAAMPKDISLSGIDHIAYALRSGELDSWVLYYRAVLGFDAEPTLLLSDPNGVVKSRTVTSRDHGVRLPLNISEGIRTSTAQSVESHGGAGVHHVAFSTPDIFATVAALRARGAKLLPIPANYYEDLQTRFELQPDFVGRLRDADILYDRIGDGEFLHVYSEPFQDSFFFEFLQRIGGYDQYGAVNAPIRMAAFARVAREQQRGELL